MDANSFDPAQTLTPDDPLRDTSVEDWIAKVKEDHPDIAAQLVTDPQAAVRSLADRGVPPPTMAFSDPYGNNIDPNSGMPTQSNGAPVPPQKYEGRPDPTANQGPYVMDKGPATGITPPGSTPPPGNPLPALQNSLDPEENPSPVAPGTVPLPTAKPDQATDISAQSKTKDASGTSDLSKMLGGLKALQPPPVNAVGTPSVRSPSAVHAPDITQLLQLFGQQSTPSPVNTLGRLLVAGKA